MPSFMGQRVILPSNLPVIDNINAVELRVFVHSRGADASG